MLGSATIETAIGLAVVFAATALFATTVEEIVAGLRHSRALQLRDYLVRLFDDRELKAAGRFYGHPLIHTLRRCVAASTEPADDARRIPARELPSYIPSELFAAVTLDLIRDAAHVDRVDPRTLPELERAILARPGIRDALVAQVVLHLIDRVQSKSASAGDQELLDAIARWYDDAMDRVSGWYKLQIQKRLFVIGLVIAGVFNIDAIHLAARLHADPALRQRSVALAEAMSASEPRSIRSRPDTTEVADSVARERTIEAATEALRVMESVHGSGLPIGWSEFGKRGSVQALDVLAMLFGWTIVAVATLLGAPFWFDLLKRFVTIRNAGKKPKSIAESHQEDEAPSARGRVVTASEPPDA